MANQPSYFAGNSPFSLLGDDDDAFSGNPTSLMGADPAAAYAAQAAAQNAGRAAAVKQAMANQLSGGSDRIRYQPLALDSITAVAAGVAGAAGGTTTITANPQRPFRAERLIVNCPGTTIGNGQTAAPGLVGGAILCPFVINSILVGVDNQTLSSVGSLPGAMFAPNAVAISMKFTTAIPGIGMSVNVTNYDSTVGGCRFLGALLGTALG